MVRCRRCGEDVVQRPVARLVLVGVAMLALAPFGVVWPPLWLPALLVALAGTYLVAWAVIGHGRWCRRCKRFDGV
jgi:fatty acid desaturase